MTALPDDHARVTDAFGSALVRRAIVTKDAFERALETSRTSGVPLQDVIVGLGLADERTAYNVLAGAAGLPFADVRDIKPTPLARRLVPAPIVHRHEVLPLEIDDRVVRYATATPRDPEAERAVSMATGRPTMALVACRSDLRSAIAQTSDSSSSESCRPGPAVAPRETNRTILIVDDDAITRALVRLLLERDGDRVLEAVNGRHALEIAGADAPDLIVMDLVMPELDGYGAIEEFRRQPRHSSTPIVVVTSEEGPTVQQRVLDVGADDYILKPFEPTALTSRIKAAFKRQQWMVT